MYGPPIRPLHDTDYGWSPLFWSTRFVPETSLKKKQRCLSLGGNGGAQLGAREGCRGAGGLLSLAGTYPNSPRVQGYLAHKK